MYIYVMLGSMIWNQEKRSNLKKKTLAIQVYSFFLFYLHFKDEVE